MSLSKRPFFNDIMAGCLKIWFSNDCCCIRYQFHFCEIWNCWMVSVCYEGQDSFLCFVSSEEGLCPSLKFHFWERAVNRVSRITSLHKVFFKCGNVSLKCLFEDFILRSLRASPLTKPFFSPGGWHVGKNVYWNVSDCVIIWRTDSLLNPALALVIWWCLRNSHLYNLSSVMN